MASDKLLVFLAINLFLALVSTTTTTNAAATCPIAATDFALCLDVLGIVDVRASVGVLDYPQPSSAYCCKSFGLVTLDSELKACLNLLQVVQLDVDVSLNILQAPCQA